MSCELLPAGALALATERRYSFTNIVTLISLAILINSGLSIVSAIPTPARELRTADSNNMKLEPWMHSCGTPLSLTTRKTPHRHRIHRTLKLVHTQIKLAKSYLHSQVPPHYYKVYKELKQQYRLDWLPKDQLLWYNGNFSVSDDPTASSVNNSVSCLNKNKKAQVVLPKFHEGLQRFAVTFHYLRVFQLTSDINPQEARDRYMVINGIYNEIVRLLCEVESATTFLRITLPTLYDSVLLTNRTGWNQGGDRTTMAVQDSGIIKQFQTFLQEWNLAFRHATKPGQKSVCWTAKDNVEPKKKKYSKNKKTRNKGQSSKRRHAVGRKTVPYKHRQTFRQESKRLLARRKLFRDLLLA